MLDLRWVVEYGNQPRPPIPGISYRQVFFRCEAVVNITQLKPNNKNKKKRNYNAYIHYKFIKGKQVQTLFKTISQCCGMLTLASKSPTE